MLIGLWCHTYAAKAVVAFHTTYWRHHLHTAHGCVPLPCDHLEAPEQSVVGPTITIRISAAMVVARDRDALERRSFAAASQC